MQGPEFYDDPEVFSIYMRHRQRDNNPNITMEMPVTLELLGNVANKRLLDLGCGAGDFGELMLQMGCASYTGIEASQNMYNLASQRSIADNYHIIHTQIQDWDYPQGSFDLVLSRLVFHYIDDIRAVFYKVRTCLVETGRFVFCVEHPLITASNKSAGTGLNGVEDWIVDDYFVRGRREVQWMGNTVIKYHRTVEDYFRLLQESSFKVVSLRESDPQPEYFEDEELYKRRLRVPRFLFFAAQAHQ